MSITQYFPPGADKVVFNKNLSSRLSEPRVQFWFLTVMAALLLLPKIGDGLLANYDDCYYAQKAKEILSSGDWWTMHYAGRSKFDNPPLFLWLIAVAFKLFGVSKFSAVCFSAVGGILAISLTYKITRYFFAPHAAYLSSFFLLTTPYFTKFARRAMMDVFLAFLYLLAFWSFLKGLEQFENKGRPTWLLLSGFAVGLAVMTKSILGVLPLAVMLLFLLLSGRFRVLIHPLALGGVILAAAVALPWFAGQYVLHGKVFLQVHFGSLIWERAVVGRYGDPAWYAHLGYLWDMLNDAWPWVLIFFAGTVYHAVHIFRSRSSEQIAGGKARIRNYSSSQGTFSPRDGSIFITLWVVLVIGIVSLAQERMLRYIIPVFPGMAIAAGAMLGGFLEKEKRRNRLFNYTAVLLVLAAVVVILTPVRLSKPRKAQLYQLARVASQVVPEGEEVLNLNQYYWSVNNIFYFYSDRCITFPLKDEEKFVKLASEGRFGLLPADEYDRLFTGEKAGFPVVAECGGWVLFKGGEPVRAELPEKIGLQ